MARFHDRMPVVPCEDDALAWLGDEPLKERVKELWRVPAEVMLHELIGETERRTADPISCRSRLTREQQIAEE